MDKLAEHCSKVLEILEQNYSKQIFHTGVIKSLYDIMTEMCQGAKNSNMSYKYIDFSSLSRQFVDETTHYSSPILTELEEINKLLYGERKD